MPAVRARESIWTCSNSRLSPADCAVPVARILTGVGRGPHCSRPQDRSCKPRAVPRHGCNAQQRVRVRRRQRRRPPDSCGGPPRRPAPWHQRAAAGPPQRSRAAAMRCGRSASVRGSLSCRPPARGCGPPCRPARRPQREAAGPPLPAADSDHWPAAAFGQWVAGAAGRAVQV